MKGIKGTGKRLCCWLLVGILLTGQSSSLAYAEEANVQDDSTEAFDLEETGEQTEESILSTEMENDILQEVDLQEDDILQEADAPQEENVRASDVLRPGSIGGEKLPVGTVFDEGGLRWRVSTGGNTGEAIECLGPAEGTTVSGTLEIPFMVTHEDYVYWVPSIEPGAFANCTELTEVVMVSTSGSFSVGDQSTSSTGAFEGCTNLRKVTIGVTCQMIGNNTFRGCTSLETFEAAPTVDSGIRRSFQDIRSSAFEGCTSLREVSLGECQFLRRVSSSTFKGCTNLEKVTLPEGMTSIDQSGFEGCSSLEEIILPANLQTIGSSAFKNCEKLKSIKMPAGTEKLHGHAFEGCSSLVEVEMPDKIALIISGYSVEDIFNNCDNLKTLKIDTTAPQGGTSYVTPAVKNDKTFGTLPADRKVVFLNSDGIAALSGSDLMAAQAAYRAVNDGDTADNKWYGWEIGTVDMYPVEITVKKDDAVWADSGKNFQLSLNRVDFISYDPGNTYVLEGTYRVYEVTESGRTDTQVDVIVDKDRAAGAAEVNYYTVTFYQDLEHKVPYGIDTDQKPQIVLSGARAVKPADPAAAEGCQFGGWLKEVTITREFQLFDFTPAIDRTTDLYANWTSLYYTIEVSAGNGGSITPRNNVNVRHGADQSFVITPDRDHHIKEIIIDGTAIADADLAEKTSYTYTFLDVTEGHKIAVTFEENPTVTEPEDPNKPVTPDTPDKPGTSDKP
ncbi:MAG: leucine-rich repeat domain-containing protein, partial [Lachnospiraceae bacterium]|nr:leucine-rich repeat domain-containing protein [Lachnospiraceae bacterium]